MRRRCSEGREQDMQVIKRFVESHGAGGGSGISYALTALEAVIDETTLRKVETCQAEVLHHDLWAQLTKFPRSGLRFRAILAEREEWSTLENYELVLYLDMSSRPGIGRALFKMVTSRNATAEEYENSVWNRWSSYFGRPRAFQVDSEGAWMSRTIREGPESNDIQMGPIPGQAHWQTGGVARLISRIKDTMVTIAKDQPGRSREEYLARAMAAYNDFDRHRGLPQEAPPVPQHSKQRSERQKRHEEKEQLPEVKERHWSLKENAWRWRSPCPKELGVDRRFEISTRMWPHNFVANVLRKAKTKEAQEWVKDAALEAPPEHARAPAGWTMRLPWALTWKIDPAEPGGKKRRWTEWEHGTFAPCGVDITQKADWSFQFQKMHMEQIGEIEILPERRKLISASVTESEKSQFRVATGSLQWKGTQTGPDILAEFNLLQSKTESRTVEGLIQVNKLSRRARVFGGRCWEIFSFRSEDQLAVAGWGDAAFANKIDGKSTEGRCGEAERQGSRYGIDGVGGACPFALPFGPKGALLVPAPAAAGGAAQLRSAAAGLRPPALFELRTAGGRSRPLATGGVEQRGEPPPGAAAAAASAAGLKPGRWGQVRNQDSGDSAAAWCDQGGRWMAAVADGHGDHGQWCAEWLCDALLGLVAAALDSAGAHAALEAAFAEADAQLEGAAAAAGLDVERSGATAVVAVLLPGEGLAYFAACGDCQGMVFDCAGPGFWETDVHKPHHSAEQARILAAGGHVTLGKPAWRKRVTSRVYGPSRSYGLNIQNRSFGDLCVKRHGVVARPSLHRCALPRQPCVLLGSDGLFDYLPPALLSVTLRARLAADGCAACAEDLVRRANAGTRSRAACTATT
ncbi:unnamed protein product [Prorocentrum cordatum]|uniref:PPM-type phosphatase domain-containing protein n=1 Tax=Prorocentrum cordatum TaxID=2364126 RepID=A0ABN9UU22_9DINO|nr:unnamed protein product [Polarella glacialis]